MVRHLIETYWKDVHLRHGYELIYSPHIAKVRIAELRAACGPALACDTQPGSSH
jgi:threonyl-tRNA synthetase